MGDARFVHAYVRLTDAAEPAREIRTLTDEEVVAALTTAADVGDRYLANVLATEAMNRLGRAGAIVEHAAEGLCAVDSQGRVTFVNPAAERMLGWPADALRGLDFHDAIHHVGADGAGRPRDECPILRAAVGGVTERCDGDVFVCRGGSLLPVVYTAAPIVRRDEPAGAVVAFRDDSERRRQGEALRRERDIVARIVDTSPAAITVVDRDGRIVRANARAEEVLGITRADVTRRTYNSPAWRITDAEGAPLPDAALPFRRVMDTGKPVRGVVHTIEWPDGRRRVISVNGAPLTDGGGRVDAAVFAIEDITEQTRASAAVRESEERFRLVAIATSDAVWDWDLTTDAVWWSDGLFELFGYAPHEVEPTSASWTRRIHPEDRERVVCGIRAAIEGDAVRWEDEYRYVRRDGEAALILDRGHIIRDAAGRATRMVGAMADITRERAAEAAVRESEERFRTAFRDSAVGMALIDLEGRYVEANPAFCHVLGYSHEELTGRTFVDITHPEDRERSQMSAQWMLEGEMRTDRFEKRYVRKDGGVVWVRVTPSLVRSDRGEPLYFLSQVEDVTERRHAEAALRHEHRRLRAVLDVLPVGVFIAGADGQLAEVNDAVRSLWGNPPLVDSIAEYTQYRAWWSGTGELLAADEWAMAQVLKKGAPRVDQEVDIETFDGERRTILNSAVPILDDGEEVVGGVAVNVDITGLKRGEAELQAANQKLRAAMEASPEPTFALDLEGRVTMWSPAAERVFGWTEKEVLGRPNPIVPEAERPVFADRLERVAHGDTLLGMAGRRLTKDGGLVEVRISAAPLHDGNGEVEGVMAVAQDVTRSIRQEQELRRLNAELESRVAERTRALADANRELEAFSYSVSHDLRAPLRAMAFRSEVLLEDHEETLDAAGREHLRRLHGEALRAAGLVHDLLRLSRAEQEAVEREAVDVGALAREVSEGLARRFPGHAVELVVSPDASARADPGLLRIVLENLLGNAWKYTRGVEAPRVEVGEAEAHGGRAVFVRDNGVGFPAERAGELFEPFQRLHEGFDGSGVGLATVKRAVERHGGTAWAESPGPGAGATFYFTLGE